MRTLTKDHLDNLRAGMPPMTAVPGCDVEEVIQLLVATVAARELELEQLREAQHAYKALYKARWGSGAETEIIPATDRYVAALQAIGLRGP